ncbi:MAG: alkyl hydroperoxide reductase/Thiol specific antioxidant/Mal allergen [Acidimicrobiaceae bacterium]|nr:alkyl hydroperoxide reductase/Thiol specific antioxidant/Mal allergen [Acidimicrobiaceae bacterium]
MEQGDVVEDFELPDQTGKPRRLSELVADGPVALFFYPIAMSKGCTVESCHFRDLGAEYGAAGAQRVGISPDTVDAQRAFSDAHSFDYPLLADVGGEVAARFGVKRRFGPVPVKRHTFVIGSDRRVIGVVRSELKMDRHADEALALIRQASVAGGLGGPTEGVGG